MFVPLNDETGASDMDALAIKGGRVQLRQQDCFQSLNSRTFLFGQHARSLSVLFRLDLLVDGDLFFPGLTDLSAE